MKRIRQTTRFPAVLLVLFVSGAAFADPPAGPSDAHAAAPFDLDGGLAGEQAPATGPAQAGAASAPAAPIALSASAPPHPPPLLAPSASRDAPPATRWYEDPLGDVLAYTGLAGVAAGACLLVAAQVNIASAKKAKTYEAFLDHNARADDRRAAGAVVLGVGAALLIGGIVRYVLHEGPPRTAAKAASSTPRGAR